MLQGFQLERGDAVMLHADGESLLLQGAFEKEAYPENRRLKGNLSYLKNR